MLCRNCRGENVSSSAMVTHHKHYNLLCGVGGLNFSISILKLLELSGSIFLPAVCLCIIFVAILCQIDIREFFVHLFI